LTNIWTDRALDFIDANEDQPFFLYLPWSIPHTPLQDPDEAPSMAFNAGAKPKTAEGREVYVKMVELWIHRLDASSNLWKRAA
jgi:hypothetical protein